MPTIVIDAGHGGFDNGARYQGRTEKDDNLRLALAVGNILEQQGYDVIYTRTTDVYQSPYEKAQIANEAGADYFISFHRNSGENDNTYNGVQTLIYGGDEQAQRLAEYINQELEKTGFKNLGIEERTGLVVLRRTEMPAVLIETGFINNDRDNEIFDNNFEEIASAIAMGIERAVPLNTTSASEQISDNFNYRDVDDRDDDRDNNARDENRDNESRDNESRDNDRADYDRHKDDWYGVEVGRFRYGTTANFLAEQLADQGFASFVFEEGDMLHVAVGRETSLENVLKIQEKLRGLDYQTMIINV